MQANTANILARLRLPGTAALATPGHDKPNVMQPQNPLRRMLTCLAPAAVVFMLAAASTAHAATFTSVTAGDWNDPLTWGETKAIPTATDDVVIAGYAITITVASAEATSVSINNPGVVTVSGGQSLTAGTVSLNQGVLNGGGSLVIPSGGLTIHLGPWSGTAISIVDGAGSNVIINTHTHEVGLSGNSTYSGGTTIIGGEQFNAQHVNCFGTGPVVLNDGTRLAHLKNQPNALTINNGALIAGSWNGTVSLPTGVFAWFSGVTVAGKITGPGGINFYGNYGDVTLTNSANDFTGGTIIAYGTLHFNAPGALGTGPLTIISGSGNKADLNYVGNHQYVVLTLNGVVMHPGTYGSSTSPAVNKDPQFVGTGTVEVFAPASVAAIYSFGLPGMPAVIDQDSGTITWNLPVGTGYLLAPDYTMPTGASGSPAPLTPGDFSSPPVKYTVTSADSSANKDYFVTVNLLPPSGKVYVNIDRYSRTGLAGPAGGLGETWNQNPGANAGSALADSIGFPTSEGFTCGWNGLDAWGSPALTLLTGAAYVANGNSANLVINGLGTGKKYDLYIPSYFWDRSMAAFSTANTTTTTSPQYCDNGGAPGNHTTWVRGVNYVLFENVEPDVSNNITVTYTGNGTYAMLNGFQLVTVATTGNYASWAAAQVPPLAGGPTAVGTDGLTNLLVYALNLKTDGTNGAPGTLTGNVLTFTKRAEAVTNGDVSYAIETCTTLRDEITPGDGGWTTATTGVTNNSGTISIDLSTLGGSSHFARLVVTQE